MCFKEIDVGNLKHALWVGSFLAFQNIARTCRFSGNTGDLGAMPETIFLAAEEQHEMRPPTWRLHCPQVAA